MRAGVLFEITKEHLMQGLSGVPLGYSAISYQDPHLGLFYVGRPVADLGVRKPEEVIYLLFFGEPGTSHEVNLFFKELHDQSRLSDSLKSFVNSLPKEAKITDLFAMSLMHLSIAEPKENYLKDSKSLLAKLAQILALIFCHQNSNVFSFPQESKSYLENFLKAIAPHKTFSEPSLKFLESFFIFHLDESSSILSTFVAKCVSSKDQNVFGSLAAAILGFGEKFESKKGSKALNFALKASSIYQKYGDFDLLKEDESFPGFSDKLGKNGDSRVAFYDRMAEEILDKDPLLESLKALKAHVYQTKSKHPTIDLIAPILAQKLLGNDGLSILSAVYLLSASFGIVMNILYDRVFAKDGLGLPEISPTFLYKHRL